MAYNPQRDYVSQPVSTVGALASDVINRNREAATQAAYLEAGRITNNQVTALAGKHLPMMFRGYANTTGGRLVVANLAQAAFAQFRPQEPKLTKLGQAMAASAYQELLQTFDVEGFIADLLGTADVQSALKKIPD